MSNRKYTPKRASKKWLAGAPSHVLDIIRHSGKNAPFHGSVLYVPSKESYTCFADCWIDGREMDSDPCHPQGIGVSFQLQAHEAAAYRYRSKHRRMKWEDLPEKVKECVKRDA